MRSRVSKTQLKLCYNLSISRGSYSSRVIVWWWEGVQSSKSKGANRETHHSFWQLEIYKSRTFFWFKIFSYPWYSFTSVQQQLINIIFLGSFSVVTLYFSTCKRKRVFLEEKKTSCCCSCNEKENFRYCQNNFFLLK